LHIIDNADDPTIDITGVVPASKSCSVLLTSLNPKRCNLGIAIEVAELAQEDAVTLLLNESSSGNVYDSSTRRTAQKVVERLGRRKRAKFQAVTPTDVYRSLSIGYKSSWSISCT
jgi:hypothetical protein